MSIAFLNRCAWTPASSGTGDFVLSAAKSGFYAPASCANPAVVGGATYHYFAVSADGSEHEEGDGVWTSGTSTLARTTVRNSSNSGSKVSFTAAPTVYMGGPTAADMPGRLLRSTVYTSSTTWTKQSDVGFVVAEAIGGGGSGAGAASTTSQISTGAGGSGGGYSKKRIAASSLGSTETVTVGAGGAATSAANVNGNNGSTSSFGAHCSAGGGSGGWAATSGATCFASGRAGGSGSSGDINLRGGASGASLGSFTAPFFVLPGNGGDGYRGGGAPATSAFGNGAAGSGFGAGGAGAVAYGSNTPYVGGNGDTGAVIVTEYS